MAFKLAEAFVRIFANDADFQAGLGRTENKLRSVISRIQMAVGGIGLLAIGWRAVAVGGKAIEAAEGAIDSQQRLQALLKATAGAAGLTAEELDRLATDFQKATTFDDDSIKEAMALLLTFKSVGKESFLSATVAAMDLSASGFGSLSGAALQLGKALENPARGMTALARSGVTFTDTEKKRIVDLQKANKLYEAQVVILKAVQGQVGGVAAQLAKTPSGQLKQTTNVLGDMYEVLGAKLLPVAIAFTQASTYFVEVFAVLASVFQSINPELGAFVIKTVAWIAATVVAISILGKLVAAINLVRLALKAQLTQQILMYAFSGPKGWAILIGGAAAAGIALGYVASKYSEINKEAAKEAKVSAQAQAALAGKLGLKPTTGGRPWKLDVEVVKGFIGFEELGKKMQEGYLKQGDKDDKMLGFMELGAAQGKAQTDILAQIRDGVQGLQGGGLEMAEE